MSALNETRLRVWRAQPASFFAEAAVPGESERQPTFGGRRGAATGPGAGPAAAAQHRDLQFNLFLVKDDEPLLYHTGMRGMFPVIHEAVGRLIDPSDLRWISWSHFEVDECGALNEWLETTRAVSGRRLRSFCWLSDTPAQAAAGVPPSIGSRGSRIFSTSPVRGSGGLRTRRRPPSTFSTTSMGMGPRVK